MCRMIRGVERGAAVAIPIDPTSNESTAFVNHQGRQHTFCSGSLHCDRRCSRKGQMVLQTSPRHVDHCGSAGGQPAGSKVALEPQATCWNPPRRPSCGGDYLRTVLTHDWETLPTGQERSNGPMDLLYLYLPDTPGRPTAPLTCRWRRVRCSCPRVHSISQSRQALCACSYMYTQTITYHQHSNALVRGQARAMYLELQNKWPFSKTQSSFFQGQFSILSAFSMENSKTVGHLYCNSQYLYEAQSVYEIHHF